jgi:methyl-accepting chemotaxis protein
MNLQENVNHVVIQVTSANEKISDTSATMEELAAGMEEVSATVEEISTSSNNLYNSMINMADKATEGSNFAKEIKARAEKLKQEAIISKSTTYNMVNQISEVLIRSMENSKQVERINNLTGNILEITEQTNLLALNASIEAARAGEAGRGFAVVADEIRKLADNSRNTASDIQQVSAVVTNAVNELASNSNSMLEFIKTTVLIDYDKLVSTGEQYDKDATGVDDIMLSFTTNTTKLQNTVEQMNLSMEGISITVDESAKGISSVAENASDLVYGIGNIQQEMVHSEGISKKLKQEVDIFTNI